MHERTVLLIEDTDDDVELTLRSFKKLNFPNPIVVARNGQEALDYLFAQGAHADRDPQRQPVLILMDLKLPIVHGREVLRQIRSNAATKLVPVVILTTSLEEKDKIECYSLGANSYVRKPVDFDRFMEAVKQLGIYWLILNENPQTNRP